MLKTFRVSIYNLCGLVMVIQVKAYSSEVIIQYYADTLKGGYYAIVEETV